MAFGWKLYGDGKTPPLGEAVAPDERLTWPRTVGIGAQHVVAADQVGQGAAEGVLVDRLLEPVQDGEVEQPRR